MIQIDLADACKLPLADQSVDLVFGSPPYTDRRTYGTEGIARSVGTWIPWMLDVTRESLRVSRGPVVWVVNGCMVAKCYQPAVEGLIWEAHKAGIRCEHPLIWHKNAAPNRRDWWCNGWEYIAAFYPAGWDHAFDWEAVATPQKYMKGGGFRQRRRDGSRKVAEAKPRNPMARPYDVLRVTVGGGHMGSELAHENEAPFPLTLAEPVLKALTCEGATVCDPFSGSGTTAHAAYNLGRNARCFDIRLSQVLLGRKRLKEVREANAAVN